MLAAGSDQHGQNMTVCRCSSTLNLKWNKVCPVNYIFQSSSFCAAESCCQGLPECHRIQQVGTVPSLQFNGQKCMNHDNWDYRIKILLSWGAPAVSNCCWNLFSRPIIADLPLQFAMCATHSSEWLWWSCGDSEGWVHQTCKLLSIPPFCFPIVRDYNTVQLKLYLKPFIGDCHPSV